MDLVVMSLERWDTVWRRNQHLVAGLLRERPDLRVLFVEPAEDPAYQLLRRRLPRRGSGLREVPLSGVVRPGTLMAYQPTKLAPRRLDPRVDKRLADKVVRTATRLGMSRPVLWVNDPLGAEVLRRTGWPALYDVTDDWLLASRTSAEQERLARQESYLLSECLEVVVCSHDLVRSRSRHRNVRLIPNAVDLAAYRTRRSRPSDLPTERSALYVGTLHRDRLDVELCVRTAQEVSGVGRLVMLGPVALDAEDRERLLASGVVLLGARPVDEVPAYLQHADVLVVPHVVTGFTQSLDPIKAYEYRAAGRPVVSTPVAGFVDHVGGLVTIVDADDYPRVVRDRLAEPLASVSVSGVPDWSERVAAMGEVLDTVAAGR